MCLRSFKGLIFVFGLQMRHLFHSLWLAKLQSEWSDLALFPTTGDELLLSKSKGLPLAYFCKTSTIKIIQEFVVFLYVMAVWNNTHEKRREQVLVARCPVVYKGLRMWWSVLVSENRLETVTASSLVPQQSEFAHFFLKQVIYPRTWIRNSGGKITLILSITKPYFSQPLSFKPPYNLFKDY